MLIIWILIFGASLAVLIKAADYFTEAAEKIGLALKISPFVLGLTIVTFGTTLPELATSIVAVIKNQTEIVAANAIGSNIANILLIIGIVAVVAKVLIVKRSLIEIDLPLLAGAVALITVICWDKQITMGEGIVAILGYLVYCFYAFQEEKREEGGRAGILKGGELPVTREKRHFFRRKNRPLNFSLILILLASAAAVYLGATFTVKAMMGLADILNISSSIVAIIALAIGTSLPELFVCLSAVKRGQFDIALGNVFGANIFNILMITGVASLFRTLTVDQATFGIGIPFLIGATVLYIFSGISGKIHKWDGLMYLLIYVMFVAKLIGLF